MAGKLKISKGQKGQKKVTHEKKEEGRITRVMRFCSVLHSCSLFSSAEWTEEREHRRHGGGKRRKKKKKKKKKAAIFVIAFFFHEC